MFSVDDKFILAGLKVLRDGATLSVSGLYSISHFRIPRDVEVKVVPTLPVNVPRRVSTCLYLSLPSPQLVGEGDSLWLTLPYEVAIVAEGKVLTVASPFKVKHTVVGRPEDGEICRWHKSKIIDNPNAYKGPEALAKLEVKEGGAGVADGVVMGLRGMDLYMAGTKVYYEALTGRLKGNLIRASGSNTAPREGLTKIPKVATPSRLMGILSAFIEAI